MYHTAPASDKNRQSLVAGRQGKVAVCIMAQNLCVYHSHYAEWFCLLAECSPGCVSDKDNGKGKIQKKFQYCPSDVPKENYEVTQHGCFSLATRTVPCCSFIILFIPLFLWVGQSRKKAYNLSMQFLAQEGTSKSTHYYYSSPTLTNIYDTISASLHHIHHYKSVTIG